MVKNDLLTGEKFEVLRVNQKFANTKNRITYYNKMANHLRHSIAHINKPLHINHRILNEVLENKAEVTLHKQFLLGKGFSFGVHTHFENYDGKTQFAIYQYIVIVLENEQIKIVKK